MVLPKPGKYVVAVSGGVDSVVLLDILARRPEFDLVIGHLDHGIRVDSADDRAFVESLGGTLSVPPVVSKSIKLGPAASEAAAREARYEFLRQVMKDSGSKAILTAHHQDDLIETVILNMLRGTGRKGLSPLESQHDVIRPLLNVPKAEIIEYARKHKLQWREDSTNRDETYLRNYVRRQITRKLSASQRAQWLKTINNSSRANKELDTLLVKYVNEQSAGNHINRTWFNGLPHKVALEFLAAWLRYNDVRDFDKKGLERLVVAAKSGAAGKTFPVVKGYILAVNKDSLALVRPER